LPYQGWSIAILAPGRYKKAVYSLPLGKILFARLFRFAIL
jgi:hypothetical protein